MHFATRAGHCRRRGSHIAAAVATSVLGAMIFLAASTQQSWSQTAAHDPGPRSGSAAAGGPIGGLTPQERALFDAAVDVFKEVQSVAGTVQDGGHDTEAGLGPRFNLDSCAGCHQQPAIGGSSPMDNPQVAMARKAGSRNVVPFFVVPGGPVREARFRFRSDGTRDGGVKALFTVTGRSDAAGCSIAQFDFVAADRARNLSLRIPTPLFGLGLVEAISDATIRANQQANAATKRQLGIGGRPNRSGNDGTITRFGWKAQNPSLEVFSGEAYNVEQGVTNDLFTQERDQTDGCLFNQTPESSTDAAGSTPQDVMSDVQLFAAFARFLAPPARAVANDSIIRGRDQFGAIGCAMCHTPALATGDATSAALSGQQAALYSDLLLHHMGTGLADEIEQGLAKGDEFRTAPLWGLGQRLFFLHDGRTNDLRRAIAAHAGPGDQRFPPSEANGVVNRYNSLSEAQKQDVLNFLRSL